jgi:uncharacterized protein (DUF342 family)
MEQRVESFKYSVKIESSYFAAGTKPKTGEDYNVTPIKAGWIDYLCEILILIRLPKM